MKSVPPQNCSYISGLQLHRLGVGAAWTVIGQREFPPTTVSRP